MTLGEKIRAARKAKGLTQKELAVMIKAAHNSISNWENDQNNPDPNTIQHLCWALDFTYAMHNHSGNLTDKDKEILLSMAQQLADAHRKKDAVGDSE